MVEIQMYQMVGDLEIESEGMLCKLKSDFKSRLGRGDTDEVGIEELLRYIEFES
jgi:hypothetical protein